MFRVGAEERIDDGRRILVTDAPHVVRREPGQFHRPSDGVFDEANFIDQAALFRVVRRKNLPGRRLFKRFGIVAEFWTAAYDDFFESIKTLIDKSLQQLPLLLALFWR